MSYNILGWISLNSVLSLKLAIYYNTDDLIYTYTKLIEPKLNIVMVVLAFVL